MADAGKIVITPKGKYNSTTTYEWLDEVTYDGKAYIALKTVTGVTPIDDGVNWRLFLAPNDIVAGNLVPTFTDESTRTNIISGENLSTILGKVKKYFTDLKGHAFNDPVNNLTTSTTGSALDASQGKVLQGEVDDINSNLVDQKMLGWSVPSECPIQNYVDSDGVFHQKVGRVDLGSLNWTDNGDHKIWYTPPVSNSKVDSTNGYCKGFEIVEYIALGVQSIVIHHPSGNSYIKFRNEISDIKQALQGVYLYYELAEEILIKVDGNEAVTKVNESLSALGKCKNLLKPTLQTTTQNGVTCTNNGDGTYTLNGTASEITTFILHDMKLDSSLSYKLTGCPLGGDWDNGYSMYVEKQYWGIDVGKGHEITLTDAGNLCGVYIRIIKGTVCNNLVFKPMITTNLNATYDDFVPYTGDGETLTHDVAELKNDLSEQKKIYSETTINVGRQSGTTVGEYSTAEGNNTEASGSYSHAEGYGTTASRGTSHAEGYGTTASADFSHAEGYGTTASTLYSHAEGQGTTASGSCSHAEGCITTASADFSHAEGYYTQALRNQHAQGHYNNTTTATQNSTNGTSTGTAFVIGNGTNSSASNAFRVTGEGETIAKKAYSTTGADYAEYFEWEDGNENKDDRRGLFVTLKGDKIKIANESDYILGIVSALPSVIGNHDEEWMGRYILDDFGAFITEKFEYEETEIDPETGEEKTLIKTGTKWKENPDYDSEKPYTPRAERPEWDAVGMLGVLNVIDDGSCKVNGFCKVVDGGTATASDTGYRVIQRVTDNIVKIVFK